MSCPCPSCRDYRPRKSHSGSRRSQFTEGMSLGTLQVTLSSSTITPCRVRVKLNKQHCILAFQGQALRTELWTKVLEDELVLEVYHENLLLGEKSFPLRLCTFESSPFTIQIPSDFYEERIELGLELQYTPHPTGSDVFHVFRKTCLQLENAALTLQGPQGILTSMPISDAYGRYRDSTWHYVDSFSNEQSVTFLLSWKTQNPSKSQEQRQTVNLQDCKRSAPMYLDLGPEGKQMTFCLTPGLSPVLSSPRGSLHVLIPKEQNDFLQETDAGYISVQVKSPVVSDEAGNTQDFPVPDLQAAFNDSERSDLASFQLSTFTPDDKIVVTFRNRDAKGPGITALGLIKLMEIADLGGETWCKCPIQCGESLFVLHLQLEKDTETSVSAASKAVVSAGDYQSKVFFDILDMMDYKISRIKKKNSLLQVQVDKLKRKQEGQKKQLFELEHAPARAEFKSIIQRAQRKPTEPRSVKAEEERSICMCGALNPQFKGYCSACVSKLKVDYERIRTWFAPIDRSFTDCEQKLKRWKSRKIALEAKLRRLEDKVLQPFVIDQSQDALQARELREEMARLQGDMQVLQEEAKTRFEELDAEEETAAGMIRDQEEEMATASSEAEELQHRNEALKEDIDTAQSEVMSAQLFYEKHSKRLGKK